MTVAKSIRVVRRVLVGGVLYSGSDEARRLVFMTVFSTRVVIACLFTLASVNVVNNKF